MLHWPRLFLARLPCPARVRRDLRVLDWTVFAETGSPCTRHSVSPPSVRRTPSALQPMMNHRAEGSCGIGETRIDRLLACLLAACDCDREGDVAEAGWRSSAEYEYEYEYEYEVPRTPSRLPPPTSHPAKVAVRRRAKRPPRALRRGHHSRVN